MSNFEMQMFLFNYFRQLNVQNVILSKDFSSLFDIRHSALSILIVVLGKQRLGKLIGIKIT